MFLALDRKTQHLIDLLIEFTKKEIKLRYKRTYLGFFWSLLHPLVYALVYFFAFKIVMRISIQNYAIFLLCGLFPWQFLVNGAMGSVNVFIHNGTLIRKTAFPKELLALSVALNQLVHFLLAIPVLVLLLALYRIGPTWDWVYGLPLLIGFQFLMVAGICMICSVINLFFRDLERIVALGFHVLFFLTPIVYHADAIPPSLRQFIFLQPFAPTIVTYQQLFLEGHFSWFYFNWMCVYSSIIFCMGLWVFQRFRWRLAEAI